MKKMIMHWEYTNITECRTLAEIQKEVSSLIEKYGAYAKIDFDAGYNNISEQVECWREETEKEYQQRLKQEQRDKKKSQIAVEKSLQKERKEYERLKKKFGE